MRPSLSLLALIGLLTATLVGCAPDDSPAPPAPPALAAAGECSHLGDGWRGPEPCPAYTCDDGEITLEPGKVECRRPGGALAWWVDEMPGGVRVVFRPGPTPIGDGIRETTCRGGFVLYTVVRAGEDAECRCLDDTACPTTCTSARAPACCADRVDARRVACAGDRPPGDDGIGAVCALDGQPGRCQPLLVDGALRPACCL